MATQFPIIIRCDNAPSPEAQALAGTLWAQAKGDVNAARRLATEAAATLAHCPGSDFKAQPVADSPQDSADNNGAARWQKLHDELAVKRDGEVSDLTREIKARDAAYDKDRAQWTADRSAMLAAHATEVAALRAKIARLAGLDDPAPQPVAVAAPVVAVPPSPAPKVNGSAVSPGVAKWQSANVAKG